MTKNWLRDGDLSDRVDDLADRLRTYVHELETVRNVRVGFRVFLGALGLAILALLLFLWSNTLEPHTGAYYAWIEPAYALSMLSVPIAMFGIAILLPSNRRMLAVAIGGLVVAVIATAGFVLAYPSDWYYYGDDYTLPVVAVYAIGIAGLSVSTGASLRAHSPELIRAVTEINRPEPDDSGPVKVSVSDRVRQVAVPGRSGSDESSPVTLVVNGESYGFGDGDTFGRQDAPWLEDLLAACDGREGLQRISKDHVEFAVRADGAYVHDIGRNGTSLNGRDLDGMEAKLTDGDRLVLGDEARIEVRL